MIYVGIDPGRKGAIAFLVDQDEKSWEIDGWTIPMPYLNKKLDTVALNKSLAAILMVYEVTAAVELQGYRPGQAGVVNTLSNYGRILAVLELMGLPHVEVAPATWSKALKIQPGLPTKDKKAEAFRLARARWPSIVEREKLSPATDGRNEALLIARWLQMQA